MREHVAVQHSKIGQLLHKYVTGLFFVRGIVRIVQIIRYVLSFIFSHILFRKKKKQQKNEQTYVTVVEQTEQPRQSVNS